MNKNKQINKTNKINNSDASNNLFEDVQNPNAFMELATW
jgi:hypothetical protein